MKPHQILILLLHAACLGFLVSYGIHRCLLLWRRREALPSPTAPPLGQDPPRVTVQLPLYNERGVVDRLLEAVTALDYPRDRLEVQVLDDSTDATRWIAGARIRQLQKEGWDIRHLHREHRTGYKAGALEAGRQEARGELLALFDADFVPPPDFLRRLVPYFSDPEVGMVQARWDHLNREDGLLTRIQAVMLDGHFAVEQQARSDAGLFFNFNGTAGIWRAAALDGAAGWSADTLTEDLDISYRAQLAGWRFRYAPECRVPAELPARMEDFKGQQSRWARGSVQTARKLLGPILASRHPARIKAEALFHLTANLCYPALLLVAMLQFPTQELRHRFGLTPLAWLDAVFLAGGLASLAAFYIAASGRRGLRSLPGVIALGVGISLSNTLAVARGSFSVGGHFRRTPKSGGSRPAYRSRFSLSTFGELVLGLYLGAATLVALQLGMWPGIPFLALFAAGFLFTGWLSVSPRILARESAANGREGLATSSGSPGPPPSPDPWESPGRRDALSTGDP